MRVSKFRAEIEVHSVLHVRIIRFGVGDIQSLMSFCLRCGHFEGKFSNWKGRWRGEENLIFCFSAELLKPRLVIGNDMLEEADNWRLKNVWRKIEGW